MRLAYFSPLNPIQSGISDYSEDLLPWLAPLAEIDLFVDGYQPTNPTLARFAVHDVRRYAALASRYDAAIYQMGNSPAHAYIYTSLLKHPGILVLHEYVLHHLISWMSWDRGDARTYLHEFRYCYGAEGEALARSIILGQANADFFDYPLSDRVIRAARRLIVHSEFVRQAVLRVRPDADVTVVPMGIPLPADHSEGRAEARQRLGLPPDALVLGSFGHLNPYKRLDVALRAFRLLRQDYPDATYALVGSVSPSYDVAQAVRMLGLERSVRLAGYADAQAFHDYVAAADICINLRHPTAGETSASVLRLMGAGLPVLISRSGAFAELPDDACVKVDEDDAEADLVLEYLRALAADAPLRKRIGANARRYVAEKHSMANAARGYAGVLGIAYPQNALGAVQATTIQPATAMAHPKPAGTSAPRRQAAEIGATESAALDIVAAAAADLGLGESDAGLADAAKAWADLTAKR